MKNIKKIVFTLLTLFISSCSNNYPIEGERVYFSYEPKQINLGYTFTLRGEEFYNYLLSTVKEIEFVKTDCILPFPSDYAFTFINETWPRAITFYLTDIGHIFVNDFSDEYYVSISEVDIDLLRNEIINFIENSEFF